MNLVVSLSLAARLRLVVGSSFAGGFSEEVVSISNSSQLMSCLSGSRGNVQDETFLQVEHSPMYLIFSDIARSLLCILRLRKAKQ